jgi:hypothetical protein
MERDKDPISGHQMKGREPSKSKLPSDVVMGRTREVETVSTRQRHICK